MARPLIIDTTLWGESSEVKERAAEWGRVEVILDKYLMINKRPLSSNKQYFLRGKLPDFAKVHNARNAGRPANRHLHLLFFLWFHPSSDYAELQALRDEYLQSAGITPDDLRAAREHLYRLAFELAEDNGSAIVADSSKKSGVARTNFELDEDFEMLFKLVFFADEPLQVRFRQTRDTVELEFPGVWQLQVAARHWLALDSLNDMGARCLWKYDSVMQLCERVIRNKPIKFIVSIDRDGDVFHRDLYRIAHFEAERTADDERLAFVRNARRMLDAKDWPEPFVELWEKIKNQEIEVKNPWK